MRGSQPQMQNAPLADDLPSDPKWDETIRQPQFTLHPLDLQVIHVMLLLRFNFLHERFENYPKCACAKKCPDRGMTDRGVVVDSRWWNNNTSGETLRTTRQCACDR